MMFLSRLAVVFSLVAFSLALTGCAGTAVRKPTAVVWHGRIQAVPDDIKQALWLQHVRTCGRVIGADDMSACIGTLDKAEIGRMTADLNAAEQQ